MQSRICILYLHGPQTKGHSKSQTQINMFSAIFDLAPVGASHSEVSTIQLALTTIAPTPIGPHTA
jgi:hypothetical protein